MVNNETSEQNCPPGTSSAQVNFAPVPILTYQLPRNPCIFTGGDDQDASKWLKDFERIASYNRWDEQMCLANVIFYLTGTARQWFDNNEDTFADWTTFKISLTNTFCRTEDLKRKAETLLHTRAQQIGESSESYTQDVLSLCRKVNPSMPEDEKIAHLMKGITEDLYQILSAQDYDTVEAFVKRCRHIESLRRRRVTRPKFQRLPNVSTFSAETELSDIRCIIRDIIREELQKVFPEMQCHISNEPEPATDVPSLIRKEITEALAPLAESRVQTTTSRRSVPQPQQPRRSQDLRNSTGTPRKTDLWRTSSNVPICYHCGRPGHVLRYCRERRQAFAEARTSRSNFRRDTDSESLRSFDDTYTQPNSNYRSNSPYPNRSSNRRQSQSPARRPSRSPRRSREEN